MSQRRACRGTIQCQGGIEIDTTIGSCVLITRPSDYRAGWVADETLVDRECRGSVSGPACEISRAGAEIFRDDRAGQRDTRRAIGTVFKVNAAAIDLGRVECTRCVSDDE